MYIMLVISDVHNIHSLQQMTYIYVGPYSQLSHSQMFEPG